ncbi:MAG: AI-2E family transporter [Planctomycetes bacterium]|nr:AI-2E family transporter [Planctomycetota bacterium]
MSSLTENAKSLPPPWDRIFSLGTRTFVWGLLLAVLYILSPFLLLIFLTFVFAYIQAHGVDGLAHRIKSRPLRVTIVGLVFLGTLFATGFTLAPQVNEQAMTFWKNRDDYIEQADVELDKFIRKWPAIHEPLLKHQEMARQEARAELESKKAIAGGIAKEAGAAADRVKDDAGSGDGDPPGASPPEQAGQDPAKTPGTDTQSPGSPVPPPATKLALIADLFEKAKATLAASSLQIGQSVLGYASAFLLALLFSFLIVLDLPKISRGVRGLGNTKVGFIYDEVADNIAGFGRVLGRALEAQLFIAIVNTILTAIGIWMLDFENLLVLSTIVFFCSFIPVAGTFMSSAPICLVALQTGGVGTMMLAIMLICIIHAIETYVLNPQIYGHHMHMNPVVVLIVLTVGGKLFGVWGLLLGIPIVNYIWRHAIRKPEERPAEI